MRSKQSEKDYQGYLIDLDGTIYLEKNQFQPENVLSSSYRKRFAFLFVTNNTTKSPETVAQRLANEFDIHVPASLVYTAILATIDYMKETNRGKKVFVIGEAGLIDLILEAGFEWDETNPDYVVVGLDTELSYEKWF